MDEIFKKSDDKWTAFICRCRKESAEEAIEIAREVKHRVPGYDTLGMPEAVVVSLGDEYEAHITSIDSDQWFMVTAEKYDGSFTVQVQCDMILDGIAAVWKAFADHAEGRGDAS